MPHAQLGMTAVQALILGITEGVTEYLPVSSTGHLFLVQRLVGVGNSAIERGAQVGWSASAFKPPLSSASYWG